VLAPKIRTALTSFEIAVVNIALLYRYLLKSKLRLFNRQLKISQKAKMTGLKHKLLHSYTETGIVMGIE